MSKAAKRERQRQNREAQRQYQEVLARRRRRMRLGRNLSILLVPVLVVVGIVTLTSDEPSAASGCTKVDAPPVKDQTFAEAPPMSLDPTKTYLATIDTNCGSFTITLDSTQAPQTVNSFVFLARQGFYDDLAFHRVVRDFVVQGGDPRRDGTGGPGYELPDEPPADGYRKGTVAMANSGPGTTGSQFFISVSDDAGDRLEANGGPPYLYSVLGQVTSGFKTIQRMNAQGVAGDSAERPLETLVIRKVIIDETSAAATTTTTASTPPSS